MKNKNLKHKIKRFLQKFCYKKTEQDIEIMTEEILKVFKGGVNVG